MTAVPTTVDFPRPVPAERVSPTAWRTVVDGVEVGLSNLTKPYWGPEGYTKGDLVAYYANIAEWILPVLRDRALTLKRMPDGADGDFFYAKQAPPHTPAWMPRAPITSDDTGKTIDYLMAQDTASLLYLANLGCIEMHPWHSRVDALGRPDYAFFDLDPFAVPFATVRQVALLVKTALDGLGLRAYPRTSGSTGIHVYVPIDRVHSYAEVRGWVGRVCQLLHRADPGRTTMAWQKSDRTGRVFLDAGMNTEGRNIAAAYSLRPERGAPVSTPLRWEELATDVEPQDFTIATIWRRLQEVGDIFSPVLAGGQDLRAAMAAVGMVAEDAPRAARHSVSARTEEPGELATYRSMRDFTVTPEPGGRTADEPSDRTADEPGHRTADEPGDRTPEEPGDRTPEEPGDPTPEEPGDRTADEPGDRTAGEPGDRTAKEPGHRTPDEPGDRTAEEPGDAQARHDRPDRHHDAPDGHDLHGRHARAASADATRRFVIQHHLATRLHHDLRLERGGTLRSWAVPKGLPDVPGLPHLAIHTEDHPLEYLTFSGEIPEGEYGAGSMRIWDTGTYRTVEWTDRKVTVALEGVRHRGEWHLFRTGRDDPRQWMVTRARPAAPLPAAPPRIAPMLATLRAAPFDDPDWVFEVKWDGVRAIATTSRPGAGPDGRTRLCSRAGNDITEAYPELAPLWERVLARNAVLDGEIVVMGSDGRPSFELLQQRMHLRDAGAVDRARRARPVTYVVFDLLFVDGGSVLDEPLDVRAALLDDVLIPGGAVVRSDVVAEHGVALFEAVTRQGLEGVVAKRRDAAYLPGRRTKDWRKIKVRRAGTVVVGGWLEGSSGLRGQLGSLLVGAYQGGDLRFLGRVGSGIDEQERGRLSELLGARARSSSPFVDADPGRRPAGEVHWVDPTLACRVEFSELTSGSRLRAPTYQGLAPEVEPRACLLEDLPGRQEQVGS